MYSAKMNSLWKVLSTLILVGKIVSPGAAAAIDHSVPTIDPYSAPMSHLRVAHPDRIWFSDHPEVPTGDGPWAFSNDKGTVPGYWVPFNGTTEFPSNGSYEKWSTTADKKIDTTETSANEKRELPRYINGYSASNCASESFRAQISDPQAYVCYGIWEDGGPVVSLFASDRTTQTNLYIDAGCNNFYITGRNWSGCSIPYVVTINSIWSTA